MASLFEKISKILKPTAKANSNEEFRSKYRHYQSLLVSNDEALERMAILSEMLSQKEPFAFGRGRRLIMGILENTSQMIDNLEIMCGERYASLKQNFRTIAENVDGYFFPTNGMNREKGARTCDDVPYSIELNKINIQYIGMVGGKMARLGEVKNILGMPVPNGVCITSRCFEEFLTLNNLREKINDFASNLDINNSVELQEASRAIQAMLVSAPIPLHIEQEILNAYDQLCQRVGKECLTAIRSSAVGEDDARHSFAGLHYTALNVSRNNIVDACWEVLISKYLPESMVYRYVTGLRDIDMPMNIGCMQMLDSQVSGTLFTVDPQRKKPGMIIQAVCGLGSLIVEGKVTPQEYIVERNTEARVLDFAPGNQTFLLRPRESDGLDQVTMAAGIADKPFLTQKQIEFLVKYGLHIEAHFSTPQDIEWSITQDGRIFILQTRPLQIVDVEAKSPKKYSLTDLKANHPVLIEGGEIACQGIGSGPVFITRQERFLVDFPAGGVLVVKRTSPAYARVLHKAAAVIAEIGSTTGHLSIIARELGVPTILNVKEAIQRIRNGDVVTVDAYHGAVFAGQIDDISDEDIRKLRHSKPFHDTPIYKMIDQVAKSILPLNLIDPQAESFKPQNCQTAHDITRFCHETAILEMFNINDARHNEIGQVRKLDFNIPLEIYIIDLGGGLTECTPAAVVKPQDISSRPFKALLEGMGTPGLPWAGPVPMDLRGFAGLIMNTMVDTGRSRREMGSRSYAMISTDYVNFSARLGYHFSSLDAYVSSSVHRNYVSYRFRGGAADAVRRERRAKFISAVLKQNGFHVVQHLDHVHSTIRKIEEQHVLDLLKLVGRLMGAIRNADVTMFSDEQIHLYAKAFLGGSVSPVKTVHLQNQNKTKGV